MKRIKAEISELIDEYNEKIKQEKEDKYMSSSGELTLIEERIKMYEEFNTKLWNLLLSIR